MLPSRPLDRARPAGTRPSSLISSLGKGWDQGQRILASCLVALSLTAHAQQSASAQQPCDDPALLALPPDQLAEHLPRCEKNPAYLLQLGQARNRQHRYEQAADHLERALMLAPDQPATLLQYAIALAGSGDILSALNLMGDLRQRPDLPIPLRAELQALATRWTQRLQPPADMLLPWIGSASANADTPQQTTALSAALTQGYDSNLQGASRLSALTLTLPDQSITLPIAPDQQPRAGAVLQAELRASHHRRMAGGGRWSLQGALQQRHTPALPDLSSTQAELQLDYTAAPIWQASSAIENVAKNPSATSATSVLPGATWAPWLTIGLAGLHTPGGTRYGGRSLSLGLERARSATRSGEGDCTGRWAIDTQQRSLRHNPTLSSHYLGTSLQWQCTYAGASRQWLTALRAGRDRARDPGRPGGDQAQAGLRLGLLAPAPALPGLALGGAPRWLLDADYTYSRDARGYSPLLEEGRVRHSHRLTLRLEWQQPIAAGLQFVLGVESVTQNASLPLFRVRSHGLWLGMRGQW